MSAEQAGGKKKRQKKWKDPDKPKRPFSAYNFFAKEMYKPIQANLVKSCTTNPADIKATNVMSEIAAQWRNLSEVKRVKFNKLAVKAKATHTIDMEVYNEKKRNGLTEAKPKRKKDKTKPKRAMSAYLYFGKEARSKVKNDLTSAFCLLLLFFFKMIIFFVLHFMSNLTYIYMNFFCFFFDF